VSVLGALAAFAQWSSGSPGAGLVVSVLGCLAGFGSAIVAEAAGTDRRHLRLGLAGLLLNLAIATFWSVLAVGAYIGS
jgi:hypothetical protein